MSDIRIDRETSRSLSDVPTGGPHAWIVWGLATVFVVWLFAIQTGYAVVSPDIQKSADLTIVEIGVAASVYTWVFALAQFFSGALLDRFGSSPLLAIAVGLVTVGAFLYSATSNFATLAIAQAVLALGASFGFVGAGYIGGQWFVAARYGLMFGLVQGFASLGSAIGQPVILLMLKNLSWQQLLVTFGTFGVLLTILFFVIVRNRTRPNASATSRSSNVAVGILRELGQCFVNLRVVLAAILAGAAFGAMLAIGTLWGPRIMEARGNDQEFSTILTALSWLGLAIGAPLVNVVSNRWGSRKWPAAIGLLLQTLAVALVIYLPLGSPGLALSLMFAVGLFSGSQMLGFTIAAEAVAPGLIGSASAIVNGICFLLGGVLISIPSALLPEAPTLSDFQSALWLIPAVLLVGTLAAVLIPERHQHEGETNAVLSA